MPTDLQNRSLCVTRCVAQCLRIWDVVFIGVTELRIVRLEDDNIVKLFDFQLLSRIVVCVDIIDDVCQQWDFRVAHVCVPAKSRGYLVRSPGRDNTCIGRARHHGVRHQHQQFLQLDRNG